MSKLKKDLKKKLEREIANLVDDVQIFDSKINTVQHVTPAALLKSFSHEIDFFHKKKNFYTLPEDYASSDRDCADRLLTHVESVCFDAVGNFIKNAELVPEDQRQFVELLDLVVFSHRRNIINRFIAKFYVYMASLILRAPSSQEKAPISERHFKKALSSHLALDLAIDVDFFDEHIYKVARVSPYLMKKLALKLASKKLVLTVAETDTFTADTCLATALDESTPALNAEYKIILSPKVQLEFKNSSKTGLCLFEWNTVSRNLSQVDS